MINPTEYIIPINDILLESSWYLYYLANSPFIRGLKEPAIPAKSRPTISNTVKNGKLNIIFPVQTGAFKTKKVHLTLRVRSTKRPTNEDAIVAGSK